MLYINKIHAICKTILQNTITFKTWKTNTVTKVTNGWQLYANILISCFMQIRDCWQNLTLLIVKENHNKNITHNNKFVLFSVRYFFGLNFILNYEIIPNPHLRERAWGMVDNSDLFSSQIYGHLCIWKSPSISSFLDCLHWIWQTIMKINHLNFNMIPLLHEMLNCTGQHHPSWKNMFRFR